MEPKLIAENTILFPGENNTLIWKNVAFDPNLDIKHLVDKKIDKVYISHGHADHFRQANYLRELGAKVYAPKKEAIFIEDPSINVRGMFSWAALPPTMVTRFFVGNACKVDFYTDDLVNDNITTIPLPGHSIGHVGFLLPNKIFYIGDALWQKNMWDIFPLPYMIDIGQVRESLNTITTIDYDLLIPAHGKPINRDESLEHIAFELERLKEIDEIILELLVTPMRTEDLAQVFSKQLNLLDRLNQYWITLVVIKGFLVNLYERDLIDCEYEGYQAKWKTK